MISTQDMQELEKNAIGRGISILSLMENAGREIAEIIKEKYTGHVVIFCGTGNNGGNGFVAARYLLEEFPVIILFFGSPEALGEEAKENYQKVLNQVNIIEINDNSDLTQFHFQGNLILVDALLGTGLYGTIREPISLGIDFFNSLNGEKIAIDVPSGMHPDTGVVEDKSCQVDLIISLHDIKLGLDKLEKKCIIVDVGITD